MTAASNAAYRNMDDALALVETIRQAARTGLPCDLERIDSHIGQDPRRGDVWGPGRRIPAELIRHVLLTPDLGADPRGLSLIGATITGTLDLSRTTVPCPLSLERCRFEKPPFLKNATLSELSFSGSHMPGLNLDGARIGGDVDLAGLRATGEVRAIGAHITGQFYLTDAILQNYAATALCLIGARIDGGAIFANLRATGQVCAIGAHIIGQLQFTDAVIKNFNETALIFDRARIDSDIYLSGLQATGQVRATGVHIAGHLSLAGAILKNYAGVALGLDEARIDGGAFLAGLHATGEVRALGAHITGQLHLTGAVLRNHAGIALGLDEARIDGGAFLAGLHATGEVHATGAHITGDFRLTGAVLENLPAALNLVRARIDGNAFLSGLRANGEVRAFGAHIAGYLNLTGAILKNYANIALSLDDVRIDGAAALGGLRAIGGVSATGAHITGYFNLTDAILENYAGVALTFDRARIGSDVSLTGLRAAGRVRATSAEISGQLYLQSIAIIGTQGEFFGQAIKVGGIFAGEGWQVAGTVTLVRAVIGDLILDDTLPVGRLNADGWSIENLGHLPPYTTRFSTRKIVTQWLKTTDNFTAQPWHEVANVFERKGMPAQARALRLEAARRGTQDFPLRSRPLRWAYGALVGHGYRPWLAAVWLLAAIAVAAGLTSWQADSFVPTNVSVLQSGLTAAKSDPALSSGLAQSQLSAGAVSGSTSCAALDRTYPCLKPLQYGFDVVLPPTLSTGQASTWRTTGTALAAAFQTLRIFAWLLITLLVAGVTGLLRKT